MVGIYHLVIRRFIVVKNRSQGVIIHLPVGKINVIYTYIYNVYIYIYLYIYNYSFDVTMGSCDGAEVCELSVIFMLSLTGNKYNPNKIGLCGDDGLTIFKNTSDHNLNKLKRFFKKCLRTKVQILL